MTLTQADIDAIADAVFLRIKAAESQPQAISIVDDVKMAMANGISPLAYIKSRSNTARKPRKEARR